MSSSLWMMTMDLPVSVQLDSVSMIDLPPHAEDLSVWVLLWLGNEAKTFSFFLSLLTRNITNMWGKLAYNCNCRCFFNTQFAPPCFFFIFVNAVLMYDLACTLPWFLPALSKFYWSSLLKRHLTLTKCAYKYLHFNNTPHVHLESSVFTRCLGSQPFWSHVCNIYGLFILLVSSLTTSQKNNSPDNVTNCD